MVVASGTRRSASARHIRAMPSSVDRPYSARNTSINPGFTEARMRATRSAPASDMRARSAGERLACAIRSAIKAASGARLCVSITDQAVCRAKLGIGGASSFRYHSGEMAGCCPVLQENLRPIAVWKGNSQCKATGAIWTDLIRRFCGCWRRRGGFRRPNWRGASGFQNHRRKRG